MDRVLKSIDQLASMLAKKLKESEDHKPLDQILKELSKYALLVRGFRSRISNGGICRSLEIEDEKIKAMQKRPLLVRLAKKGVDAEELASSCKEIKDALDTFYVSSSVFSNYSFIDLSLGWSHSISGKEHTRYPEGVSSHS